MDYVPFNAEEFYRWINDNGDGTLRLNYPLNEQSVVVDAGGFEGAWSSAIAKRYDCSIHIIEPLTHLYDNIRQNFANYPKALTHNVAIGGSTREMEISIEGDSSSLFSLSTNTQKVLCKDIGEFLKEWDIEKIDLFKINIEGGEYELLIRMIELGLQKRVKNFQIQFHRFIPDCQAKREFIQKRLSATHTQTWNYEWIWENWQLKD